MTPELTNSPTTYHDTRENRTRAHEALERARVAHRRKRYELRIDDRTTIMVEKKNFNRAYAEAYKEKLTANSLIK